MAYAVGNDLQVEHIGTSVTVPENNFAKMMYYLSSLSSCLDYAIPSGYTDYNAYYNLGENDKLEVLALTVLLSPDILENKVIFKVAPGDPVLTGKLNTFYKITNATTVIAAATNLRDTILIGDRNTTVTSIMVYTDTWLARYFFQPITAERYRLVKTGTTKSTRRSNFEVEDPPYRQAYGGSTGNCCASFWKFICLVLFVGAIVVSILLPMIVIPDCKNTFVNQFTQCWSCLIARNLTCSGAAG